MRTDELLMLKVVEENQRNEFNFLKIKLKMVPYKLNHLKLVCKVFQNDVCFVTHLPKHVKLWKSPINELT